MRQKSPIRNRMTSIGLWSLEGTPGILEVYNSVDSPPLENTEDARSSKRAEVAGKLLESLDNFNYDATAEPSDTYWIGTDEKVIDLPFFEDFSSLPSTTASLAPTVHPLDAARCVNSASVARSLDGARVKPGFEWSEWAGLDSQWCDDAVVTSQLTPPQSPNRSSMYELNSRVMPQAVPQLAHSNIDDLASLIKPEPAKEDPTLMSLLAQMNDRDLDAIVRQSVQDSFLVPELSSGQNANYSLPERTTPSGQNANYSLPTPDMYMQSAQSPGSDLYETQLEAKFVGSLDTTDSERAFSSPEHSSDSSDAHSDYSSSLGYTSDPDYTPYAAKTPESTRSVRKEAKKADKSRPKPYARKAPVPVEDKKLRKKEQNKNAATRYRIKKKMEVEEILGEEKELMDKNESLNKQVEDLARELKFMKKFMRDFFKTQGVLK